MKPIFWILLGTLTLSCTGESHFRPAVGQTKTETGDSPGGDLPGGGPGEEPAITCKTPKEFQLAKNNTPAETSVREALIRHQYHPGEITTLCKKSIDKAQKRLDDIAAGHSTICPLISLEETLADFSEETTPLTFMGYVSTNEALREESASCEELTGQFAVQIFTRRDLYNAIKDLNADTVETKRLHFETVRAFEQNGLKLDEEKLAVVRELKTKLTSLETKFSANLNNDTTSLSFSLEELLGVPATFLAGLKRTEDGKYIVTTKSTHYVQVMENAESPDTRKKMAVAYLNKAPENSALLEDAILLRQQIAHIMGYSTWADQKIFGRMAIDGSTVKKFLNGLKDRLAERNRQDLAKLQEFKKNVDHDNSPLKAWDLPYYSYQVKKRQYNLDTEKVREYFPSEVVLKGMFEVYSTLLNVTYEEVKNPDVWAKGVKLFAVKEKSTGEVLSYFFGDFSPREGKYGHAAAFTLRGGRVRGGKYNLPISAIVSNFTPPQGDKPSLLTFDEVETMFHEFGHIMHQVLTRAPYASLSGTSVAQDFVEAPSQMLENWVWEPEILNLISGHYQDHSQKLPPELLKQLLAAKDFNQGYHYTRQLMLGLFDLTCHTADGKVDVTSLYDQLYKEILGVDPVEGGHFAAGFGHLMGGYDAGYYGYLWSEVYAHDMYSEFEKKGILNSELGLKYRKIILEQGGIEEPLKLVEAFLGRAPNNDAFYKKLGLGAN